jgi:hypothetical protein
MYTATKLGDSVNQQLQRRIVTVQFTQDEGLETEHIFIKDFSFRLTDTLETIKRSVKSFLDEINTVPPVIDDLTPDAEVPPPTPTQAELDRQEWDLDVAKLKKVQELLDCGVTFSAGQITAIATLRGKIATNFKVEYLG